MDVLVECITQKSHHISYISNDNEFTGGRFKLNVATLPSMEVSTNPLEVDTNRTAPLKEDDAVVDLMFLRQLCLVIALEK